jgi:hypothetical protein
MFNASNWHKSFEHKTHMAKVYKAGATWTYEYQGAGVVNVGHAPTAEVAMQVIEAYIKAGIHIKKRKGA